MTAVTAAILVCGCDGPGGSDESLYVGSDRVRDGGEEVFDATTNAGPASPLADAPGGGEADDAIETDDLGHADANVRSFVYWADWQTVDGGTVAGTLSPAWGTIHVLYSGALVGAQTTTGTNYFGPPAAFTSATVANAPPGPGMIELSGPSTQTDTLTFSEPVQNPVLAIYNLGTGFANQSAQLLIDAPVTVLSSGLNAGGAGYWGSEMLLLVDGGVSGVGGNGVLEIEGTVSAIRWRNPNDTPYASYTGVTVGIRATR